MNDDGTECARHGKQGFGGVCVHIPKAIDSGEEVGFFWSPDPEMERPFAWCSACEEFLNKNGGDVGTLASVADFKLICAKCWDEAKAVLYKRGRGQVNGSANKLDESLRRLEPHSKTEDRLDVLRQIAEFWHGPIGADDGFTEEELGGKPIPAPLRWWFRLAGRRTWILSGQNDLLGPEKLAIGDDGRLLFYVESQGVYLWATMPDGDDPIVLGRFDEPGIPWTEEGMVLSEFLIGACMFQAIMGAPLGASASWIEQATLDKLAAELPVLSLAPRRWPGFPSQFFARGGAAMFICPNGTLQGNLGFSVWIGAKAAEPLAFLKNIVDRDWEHVVLE